jgi:hypothetical protein
MDTLNSIRNEEAESKKKKKGKKEITADETTDEAEKRNLQWTVLFDKYVMHSNDYCVFIYERHHFTTRSTIGNTTEFFMSVDAHCKFETCTCRYHAILSENGHLNINYEGEVAHLTNVTHARPVRATRREQLQQFTNLGATPNSLRLQQLTSMSTANKEAGNRNSVGSSPSVIRKISSEGNVKYRRDADLDRSLQELKVDLEKKLFPAEQVPGYLQEISVDPLRLVCFTARGVAAYHRFASTMPLSSDATGSIVINRGKRIYYYE